MAGSGGAQWNSYMGGDGDDSSDNGRMLNDSKNTKGCWNSDGSRGLISDVKASLLMIATLFLVMSFIVTWGTSTGQTLISVSLFFYLAGMLALLFDKSYCRGGLLNMTTTTRLL